MSNIARPERSSPRAEPTITGPSPERVANPTTPINNAALSFRSDESTLAQPSPEPMANPGTSTNHRALSSRRDESTIAKPFKVGSRPLGSPSPEGTAEQTALIQVQNLIKAFGSKLAVNNLSFTVARGEVLGFLGPNGAGKSTTMRMITGFIPPSDGNVRVGGYDVTTDPIPVKRLIGYLPENAPLYVDMTVRGFLMFCAELSGLHGAARKNAVHRVVEMCFLEPVLYQSVDTLSKGYRHRTCLAQSLLHDPDVLVLDEPTDGLDPNQKHEIRSLIRRMGRDKAIIFSTHILEEVEAVCSRAIIIDRGQIVASGTPVELKAKSELGGAVLLAVRGVGSAKLADRLEQIPLARKTSIIREENGEVWARIYPRATSERNGALVRNVLDAANGWQIIELRTEEGRLDDVFRSITLPETTPAKSEDK